MGAQCAHPLRSCWHSWAQVQHHAHPQHLQCVLPPQWHLVNRCESWGGLTISNMLPLHCAFDVGLKATPWWLCLPQLLETTLHRRTSPPCPHTGNAEGAIGSWRHNRLARLTPAHNPGPIRRRKDGTESYGGIRCLVLRQDQTTLLSGGSDGCGLLLLLLMLKAWSAVAAYSGSFCVHQTGLVEG